ncbi:hypothetical protein [Lutimonas zeaxanthinifaciens]|uniref:hypothetical protein n=1 Tax=Lutimonas zeaxanthinifaciens TaxID=3060215 RepID=UPI00265CD0A5|nr:hypothetical protein [Lutimonas sp. YSD2104]WKK65399.1 hypothetical protein QZH61_12520 [Lutimonas sp. YSD2104]
MLRNLIIFIFCLFYLTSCGDTGKSSKEVSKPLNASISEINKEGLFLLKKHCYICHSPISDSHDSILAPPMAAVKMRYQRRYKNKEDFIEGMVKWSVDPKKEEGIMRGAIDRFGPMPKQDFKSEDLFKIARYIYENELEEPEWFAAHAQEMHGQQ